MGPSGRRGQGLAALLAYGIVSLALYGIPILGRFSDVFVGIGKGDAKFYAWALVWWPHALGNGIDPFLATAVWAPEGANMAWVAGVPGPSLVMTPVTVTLGPIASSNVLALLSPMLAGWAAYLVCRRVAGAFWPSFAGGYLFGFSTYMVGQMHGHLNLTLVFPVALAVYLVLRRLDGTMGPRMFVLLLALVLVGQFSISTEVFATMSLFGGIALGGAFLVFGKAEERARLLRTVGLVALSYALALVIVSPYLYYAAIDIPPESVRKVDQASVDLLSFVLPTYDTLIGGEPLRPYTSAFTATPLEDGGYLGIPLVLAFLHFAITQWRRRATRLVLGFTALAALFSLGPLLHIHGREIIGLPWGLVADAPVIENALPQRFTIFLWLAVSVAMALWLAATGRHAWLRWGTVGLSAVLILPNLPGRPYHPDLHVPPFFEQGTYERYLAPEDTILVIPIRAGADPMLWQAQAWMYYKMAVGYTGTVPTPYRGERGLVALKSGKADRITAETLDAIITRHRVDAVVIEGAYAEEWRPLLGSIGSQAVRVGGVDLYLL